MTLIVCLDQRNGMRFNDRPQSTDRCVTDRIACLTAERSDVCFFETGDLSAYLSNAERLIVFRWDKVYPADTKFPMEACKKIFTLQSTENFPGHSHVMITQEVYVR